MTKPTPGPWRVYQGWVHPCFSNPTPNGDTAICEPLGPDRLANAHLIAAAPDMYEALTFIVAEQPYAATQEWRDRLEAARAKVYAAIAKAEGRKVEAVLSERQP